jgi:protein TIF31
MGVVSEEQEVPVEKTESTDNNSTSVEAAAAAIAAAEEAAILRNLLVLPPLQKDELKVVDRDELEDAVKLPPIHPDEMVTTIRTLLSEVYGYAHLTNYRLVLEAAAEGPTAQTTSDDKKKSNPTMPLVSPYTLNPVLSLPTSDQENVVVVDDYGDLTPLLEKGLKDGSAFRIVLERYDVGMVRDHVARTRILLDGNAPVTGSSLENALKQPEAKPDDEAKPEEHQKEGEEKSNESKQADKDKNDKPEHFPAIPKDKFILDGSNLKDFFYLSCGEEEILYDVEQPSGSNGHDPFHQLENKPKKKRSKKKKKEAHDSEKHSDEDDGHDESKVETTRNMLIRFNQLDELAQVKCAIRFSGFHPPPPSRRLLGDLCYLEVQPPADNEPTLFITAVPAGFYVNESSFSEGKPMFDPKPAAEPCFSHTLLDCLLQASPSFRSAWSNALAATKERAKLTQAAGASALQSLHRVAVRGDFEGFQSPRTVSLAQGLDAVVHRPSWLVPLPKAAEGERDSWTHNALHDYSPARMEDDLSNLFGMDIRSGALRDWNEELQSARDLPTENTQQRLERAQ